MFGSLLTVLWVSLVKTCSVVVPLVAGASEGSGANRAGEGGAAAAAAAAPL